MIDPSSLRQDEEVGMLDFQFSIFNWVDAA
jgi:hypothetical protein